MKNKLRKHSKTKQVHHLIKKKSDVIEREHPRTSSSQDPRHQTTEGSDETVKTLGSPKAVTKKLESDKRPNWEFETKEEYDAHWAEQQRRFNDERKRKSQLNLTQPKTHQKKWSEVQLTSTSPELEVSLHRRKSKKVLPDTPEGKFDRKKSKFKIRTTISLADSNQEQEDQEEEDNEKPRKITKSRSHWNIKQDKEKSLKHGKNKKISASMEEIGSHNIHKSKKMFEQKHQVESEKKEIEIKPSRNSVSTNQDQHQNHIMESNSNQVDKPRKKCKCIIL